MFFFNNLFQKHGLVIIPDGTPNGDVNHEPLPSGITLVTQEAAQVLESAGDGPLGESRYQSPVATLCEAADCRLVQCFPPRPADVRLRKLADEKDELLAQIRKLKNQLEEEKQKHSKVDGAFPEGENMENGTDLHFIEMQSELTSFHNHNMSYKITLCMSSLIALLFILLQETPTDRLVNTSSSFQRPNKKLVQWNKM